MICATNRQSLFCVYFDRYIRRVDTSSIFIKVEVRKYSIDDQREDNSKCNNKKTQIQIINKNFLCSLKQTLC